MRKKTYFEFMRILACGLVIFNHHAGYWLFATTSGLKQFFYMCLTMFTRVNVPIFFMISGALLLNKTESVSCVLKRFFRIVFTLLLFDFIMLLVNKLTYSAKGQAYEVSFSKLFWGFLSNSIDGTSPYWYLYAYLGFLLMLPFLRKAVIGFSKSEFNILLYVHFIVWSAIPILNIILGMFGIPNIQICWDFDVPFAFDKAFFYPLIGYYLEYNVDVEKMKNKNYVWLVIIGITGITISVICTYYEASQIGSYTQNYVQLFDYLSAIVVFLIIKSLVVKMSSNGQNGKLSTIISYIGSLTFGIYLFEPVLRRILFEKYELFAEPLLPTIIVTFGWIIICMLCGGILTYSLKKIPVVRKLL